MINQQWFFTKNVKGGKMNEIKYQKAGVEAKVYVELLQEPYYVFQLCKDLEEFEKTFWENEEVDWSDCVEDTTEYVIDFFRHKCRILRPNKEVEKLIIKEEERLRKRFENE
jgi:hypothetical protein